MAADSMKLIAYGKVLEDDNKSLKDYSIKEGDFLVVMVAKVSLKRIRFMYQMCSLSLLLSPRKTPRWKSLRKPNSHPLNQLLLRIHRPLNPSPPLSSHRSLLNLNPLLRPL